MLYAFHCLDRTDASQVRQANRKAHLAHLNTVADRILIAGPLLGADEASMIGSLLVIDFDSRADADDFARNDPYAKAGLFSSVSVTPWKKVFPA